MVFFPSVLALGVVQRLFTAEGDDHIGLFG
jgi:hypothetical protein